MMQRLKTMAPSLRHAAVFLSAAMLLTLAHGVRAQPYETPPPPAAPRELRIDAPIEQSLPNGLRVVLAERRGVQLVSAQLLVLSGSEADPPQRAGLASFTAGLLTKGTHRYSASALVQAAETLGGSIESASGWNQSAVGITVAVPQLDAALALVAEAVLRPSFAPAEIERLRTQTLDDMKVAYSQPGTLASLAAQHMLFGTGAYGHPASGTPESLARIERADLQGLHTERFRPDNAVLVLAGDLDAVTALSLAKKHFGHWKKPEAALPPTSLAGNGLPLDLAVIDMAKSGQAAVVVVLPVPDSERDRAARDVMNSVLGGGYSSRLNQEIRIKRGLSYGAGSRLEARREGGVLRVSVQTKNESAAEVLGLVQGELDGLMKAPVGNEELLARKATLIGNFSRSVETTAGLNEALGGLIVAGRAPAELQRRIETLGAVSAADVQAYATATLVPARRRVVVAGVAAQFIEALKAGGGSVTVVPQDALDLERGDSLMRR
ncbi:MAG: pitrilysin family protein [Burkholderiales bacterium]